MILCVTSSKYALCSHVEYPICLCVVRGPTQSTALSYISSVASIAWSYGSWKRTWQAPRPKNGRSSSDGFQQMKECRATKRRTKQRRKPLGTRTRAEPPPEPAPDGNDEIHYPSDGKSRVRPILGNGQAWQRALSAILERVTGCRYMKWQSDMCPPGTIFLRPNMSCDLQTGAWDATFLNIFHKYFLPR